MLTMPENGLASVVDYETARRHAASRRKIGKAVVQNAAAASRGSGETAKVIDFQDARLSRLVRLSVEEELINEILSQMNESAAAVQLALSEYLVFCQNPHVYIAVACHSLEKGSAGGENPTSAD